MACREVSNITISVVCIEVSNLKLDVYTLPAQYPAIPETLFSKSIEAAIFVKFKLI